MPCAGRKNCCKTSGRDRVLEGRKQPQQGQGAIPAPARGCGEQQDARKGFGGLGKGCQRVTWQKADQIQCCPALCVHITQHQKPLVPFLPFYWDGLGKPPKSVFGESSLRSQSWVLGKWLLYFKRVVERKEQPQSKPLRKILQ